MLLALREMLKKKWKKGASHILYIWGKTPNYI